MVPQLKEAYVAAGNNVDFEIAAEGSSAAFSNLLAGVADIGMSSRDVKDSERDSFTAKGQELKEYVAAWDMIAVIVNEKKVGLITRHLLREGIPLTDAPTPSLLEDNRQRQSDRAQPAHLLYALYVCQALSQWVEPAQRILSVRSTRRGVC